MQSCDHRAFAPNRCTSLPLYLHQVCIVQATVEAKVLLYCMADVCNNTALASTVLDCNRPSFDQCVCLQAAKRARTTTDDYLHDLLRKSENRALEAEGQTRHYSQRVRTLEWQKFHDKQSDGGLAQNYDSLTALLSRTRQEKRQVEERLHGTFTHVSSLEEKAARAEQSHAAELSAVIANLELSKKVRLLKINVCHILCLVACAVLRLMGRTCELCHALH